MSPSLDGLSVKIIENGSRIEVSYARPGEVIARGYQGEPFLRIGDKGVFENLKSPATYINKSRDGVEPPADADPNATPEWHKISGGHVARWHDHRIHYMNDNPPPQVRREPGKRHVVFPDWSIKITQNAGDDVSMPGLGATEVIAQGDLVWVPGPSPAPMWLLAAALAIGMVLIGRRRSPFISVAIATGTLVLVDLVHSFGIGFANAGTFAQQLGRTFSGSTVSIPAWIVGAGAVWFLLHKKVDGFFAAVFCGLIIAVVGGLADITVLARSQVPFAFPGSVARPLVAASLGLGIGVAIASGLAIRQLEPRLLGAKDTDDEDDV